MGADFPLPRNEIPPIKVSPREHAEAKELTDHMLAHTVLEFEKFVYRDNNHVDARLWKSIGSRDRLKLYKQREGGLTHAVRTQRLDSMSELPTAAVDAAADPGSLLLTGYWPGRMENAMYAVVTKSQEELALVVIYLHEDVADCALLHTMEGPTLEQPYRFLGYKFFVRKSPTNAHLVRNRDSLYLEASGRTTTSRGEVIGYHIMHSVDLPGFPDLTRRNSVRARQSVRYIYRQKSDNVVEIYMLGSLSIAGTLGGFSAVSTFFTADSVFGITRLVDCAEVKRLTACVRARQRNPELLAMLATRAQSTDCAICRSRKKLFAAVTLSECMTCGQFVCPRCWLQRKIFIGDGILGRFQKICVCKTCVLEANAGDFLDPIHGTHTQMRRQHTNITSQSSSDSHNSRPRRTMSTDSFLIASSDSASDSDSAYSNSEYTIVSRSASGTPRSSATTTTTTHSSSTQQAYYHTQIDRTRNGSSSNGSSNGSSTSGPVRIKRVVSRGAATRNQQQQQHQLSVADRSARGDASASHDLIPLDTDAVNRDSIASSVSYAAPPSSTSSPPPVCAIAATPRYRKPASSIASSNYYTPPSGDSVIAYGVPVGSYDSSYDSYSYGTPLPRTASASSASSARAPSVASSSVSGGAVAPEQDLVRRMMELHRVVESTYNTTQANAAKMASRY